MHYISDCVDMETIMTWRRKEGKCELQQVYDYLLKLHMLELILSLPLV